MRGQRCAVEKDGRSKGDVFLVILKAISICLTRKLK